MWDCDLQHEPTHRPRATLSLKYHLAHSSSSAGYLTKLNCFTAETLSMDCFFPPQYLIINSFFLPYRPAKMLHQQLLPSPQAALTLAPWVSPAMPRRGNRSQTTLPSNTNALKTRIRARRNRRPRPSAWALAAGPHPSHRRALHLAPPAPTHRSPARAPRVS